MANPLDAYGKVLNTRGLGTPKTRLDAMIQSGELTDPLKRFPENKRTALDDVLRFGLGLYNKKEAGGPGFYNLPPKNIQEATKQVVKAAKSEPDLTGAKFDKDGKLIGKTPDDFKPFDPTTIDNVKIFESTPGPEGPKLVQDLTKPGSVSKPFPGSGAGDEALAQLGVAENEAQRAKTQKEAITSLAQLNQEVAEDEMGRKKPSEPVIEDAFSSAMQDYIEQARGAGPKTKELSLDDYKKEFAEATGIDISGKVDKSQALMAFGLALMQNRAGKGFNVGRMLSSVGEAGEAAMPALEKAKTQARNDAIAAGKYALQTRASDRATDAANQEKLMNRGKYWIYKKGAKGEEFSEFDNGEFVDLNKFELNKLVNTPDFDKNYEFIDASDRLSILEKRAEGQDLGDMWESYERVSLIGGKADEMPPELQVVAAVADSNYKGTTPTRYKIAEDPKTVARRFAQYQQDINSGTKKMQDLLSALDSGVTIPKQFLSKANEILVAFGIGETDDVTDAKRELKNIAIDRATEILRESGKTLSDRDRDLVIERIGKISWGSADVGQIRKQLKDIYDLTILKPQRNLDTAIEWLEVNAGISFGAPEDDMPTQEELDAINKATGKNLTMDDFKK